MFSIDARSGVPIYEQLERSIVELISSGALSEDEKLPTVRETAKDLGVNPNTVQKAYQNLETRGLLYSVPAKGSYVSPKGEAMAAIRKTVMKDFREVAAAAIRCGIDKAELISEIEKRAKEKVRAK